MHSMTGTFSAHTSGAGEMYSTTGTGAAYTAGAGDDFGRIQEVNSRCPPLLSSVLDCTVLAIFGRSQEVSDCCPPFLSPAYVIDRRTFGFDDEAQDGLSLGVHGKLPLDPVLLFFFELAPVDALQKSLR